MHVSAIHQVRAGPLLLPGPVPGPGSGVQQPLTGSGARGADRTAGGSGQSRVAVSAVFGGGVRVEVERVVQFDCAFYVCGHDDVQYDADGVDDDVDRALHRAHSFSGLRTALAEDFYGRFRLLPQLFYALPAPADDAARVRRVDQQAQFHVFVLSRPLWLRAAVSGGRVRKGTHVIHEQGDLFQEVGQDVQSRADGQDTDRRDV